MTADIASLTPDELRRRIDEARVLVAALIDDNMTPFYEGECSYCGVVEDEIDNPPHKSDCAWLRARAWLANAEKGDAT